MSLATVGAVVGIAGGINSLTGGGLTSAIGLGPKSPTGQQAQQAADPFAPYRGSLGAQYAAAMQPGATTDPTQLPGYSQWMSGVLNPAMQAVQGRNAAQGKSMSGNEQQDLMKVGQQGYYGFMTDYMNRLAQGSGAANNPAAAAGLGLQQGNQNQAGVMQGLGGLVQGVQGLSGQGGQPSYQTGPGSNLGTTGGWSAQNDPNTTYNNPSGYQSGPDYFVPPPGG